MRYSFIIVFSVCFSILYGQWQGDTGVFSFYTDSIQLNDSIANTSYISQASDIADSAVWQFNINLKFNPSGSNYSTVYLKSSSSELTEFGYFIQIGSKDDDICLYRQDGSYKLSTKIIDGQNDRLDNSSNNVRITVKYTDGLWELSSKVNDGEFFQEGSVVDDTYPSSSYFGWRCIYTKTRATKFSLAQLSISGLSHLDREAPLYDTAFVLTKNKVKFSFSEDIKNAFFTYKKFKLVDLEIDGNEVSISFNQDLPERETFVIKYEVSDSANNVLIDSAKCLYIPFEVSFVKLLSPDSLMLSLNRTINSLSPESIQVPDRTITAIEHQDNQFIAVLDQPLENKKPVLLTILNIADNNGDIVKHYSKEIVWINAEFQDLVMTEIMPDPNPVIDDLPEEEYLEIFNRTPFNLPLENWYFLRDDKKYYFPNVEINPFSYALIYKESSDSVFSTISDKISLPSFPTLTNEGMSLALYNNDNELIDYIDYSKEWHIDDFHADGGFSLERIDIENPSYNDNWTSSCSDNGGTPGEINCVDAPNPDLRSPYIKYIYALDEQWLLFELSELIFTEQLYQLESYSIDSNSIVSVLPIGLPPLSQKAMLKLASPIPKGKVKYITINGLEDLSGNLIRPNNNAIAVCPLVDSSDIVINEIMFEPTTGEAEYIELYNTQSVAYDLSQLYICQKNEDGWEKGSVLSNYTRLFLPHSYIVFCNNKSALSSQYNIADSLIYELAQWDNLRNDSATLGLLNTTAQEIDVLNYNEVWHSSLLNSTKGVALERIDASTTSNDKDNWISASSLVGYGTPGRVNSQAIAERIDKKNVSIFPKVITPNNDGQDDLAYIKIDSEVSANTVKVQVYNRRGMRVKDLRENAFIGQSSILYWDGTNNDNERCAMGPYLVLVEIITTDGKVITDREEIVISSIYD